MPEYVEYADASGSDATSSDLENPAMDYDEWVKLYEVLQLPSGQFGSISIAMTHPFRLWLDLPMKVVPLLVVLVQIVIPFILLGSEPSDTLGSCPATGTWQIKTLMLAISIIYAYRLFMKSLTGFAYRIEGLQNGGAHLMDDTPDHAGVFHPDYFKQLRTLKKTVSQDSVLNYYGEFDGFMGGEYELMLYVLNLKILFHTTSPLDILLNSLAMEFLMKLDDEFKDWYMSYSAQAVTNILSCGLHKKKCGSCRLKICEMWRPFHFIVRLVISTALLGMMVYGPLCKP